jgi:5'-nucleotidase
MTNTKISKFIIFHNGKFYWENGKQVIVYVDMDNVMCKFSERQLEMIQAEPGIKYPQCQYKFFENLDPLPGAIEAYKKLELYYDVRTLTAPSVENRLCYTEKAEWIFKHLGLEAQRKLNISTDKSQFTAGQYLIDDMLMRGVAEFGDSKKREHIHFGTTNFIDWESVLKYLLSDLYVC